MSAGQILEDPQADFELGKRLGGLSHVSDDLSEFPCVVCTRPPLMVALLSWLPSYLCFSILSVLVATGLARKCGLALCFDVGSAP